MTESITIRLLGSFQTQPQAPLRRKTRAILGYLAATPRPHSRQHLSALFCQGSDDPARALRWQLSAIRQGVGSQVMLTEGETVQINRQGVWVDVWMFEQGLAKKDKNETAVSLYHGEFLAGLSLSDAPEFELWLLGERSRLHQLYEQAVAQVVKRLMEQQQYETAVSWAQRWVQSNPLLEESHTHLIWLYAKTGQRQAALTQFTHCRGLLERELAVHPSPELQTLYQAVRDNTFDRLPKTSRVVTTNLGETADFVGRTTEINQLKEMGQQGIILIEGEAGMGKSRLVQEFVRAQPPVHLFIGRCYESSRILAYHPWIEILETALADETILAMVDRFWLEQALRLLPALAVRLNMPAAGPPPSNEVEQLFTAVYHILQTVSFNLPPFPLRSSPAAFIFVDDLQWADEASLHLFHFLAQRLTGVLLIGAFRAEETAETPTLQTLISDLRRNPLLHLRLAPLEITAVQTLITHLWPALPGDYHLSVSQLLTEATGGNPLFASELLRELAHRADAPTQLPVPPSLRDLIARRLAQLPENCRQVIEAVAVLDAPFMLAQAQQISARSEEETVTAVDLGLRWRLLLSISGSQPTHYDFSHALMREAVINQLSQVRHHMLHRRAAHTLVQMAARLEPASRPKWARRIFRHARAGQDFHLILQWVEPAARYAHQLYAYREALDCWETAVSALHHLQITGEIDRKTAERQHLAFLLHQINLLALSGRWPEEAPLLSQAAQLLEKHPSPRLQATFYLYRGEFMFNQGQNEAAWGDIQQAHHYFLTVEDSKGIAHTLYLAGRIKVTLAQNREAPPLLKQALAIYQEMGDLSGEALCLSALAVSEWELGQVHLPLYQWLPRALTIAEQQHDLAGQARVAFVMAMGWNLFYHVPKLRFFTEKVRQLGQQLHDESLLDRATYLFANCSILEHDVVKGEELWKQVQQSAHARGDGWVEGWAAHILGRLRLLAGDLETAESYMVYAFELRQRMGETQNLINDLAWMGRLWQAKGQLEWSLSQTTEAITRLEAAREHVYVVDTCDMYMAHAEALAANGRLAESLVVLQQAYTELMQFAEQIQDPEVRQSYFRYLHIARIVEAWQRQEIRPYPG